MIILRLWTIDSKEYHSRSCCSCKYRYLMKCVVLSWIKMSLWKRKMLWLVDKDSFSLLISAGELWMHETTRKSCCTALPLHCGCGGSELWHYSCTALQHSQAMQCNAMPMTMCGSSILETNDCYEYKLQKCRHNKAFKIKGTGLLPFYF